MSHMTRAQGVDSIIPKYGKEKMGVSSSCSTSNKPNLLWSNENSSNSNKLDNCCTNFDVSSMPPHICSIKLILSQLDLIQVHGEQLTKNDKQLCEVIKERDALRLGCMQLKEQLESLRDAPLPSLEAVRRCQDCAKRLRASSPHSEEQSDSSAPHTCKKPRRFQERSIVYTDRLYHKNDYCYGYALDSAFKALDMESGKSASSSTDGGPPSPPQSPDTKLIIPSWRVHPISHTTLPPPSSKDENYENLSDDTFTKRHQKLEVEEKRRKRWDLQMVRQQRFIQKLREKELQRQNKTSSKKEELVSLFPDLSKVHSLEVSPVVPLVVFGANLPYLPQEEFSLPWK